MSTINNLTRRALTAGFVLSCALTILPASATEWIATDTDSEDNLRAFDRSRTRQINENFIRTWKRYQLRGHAQKYEGYVYSIAEWEIDCIERRQRILASFDYDGSGRIVNTDVWKDSESRPIPPDSRGDTEAKLICGSFFKPKK